MNKPHSAVRLWALLAFAGAWNIPVVVRLFVRYPLWSVLPFVAWGLAVVIVLAWLVPAFRRSVFVPGAGARRGASQAFGAAGGMIFVGAACYVVQRFGAGPDF